MSEIRETRKVTVVSTSGFGYKVIETGAKTWGELRSILSEDIRDIDRLTAVESIRKSTLDLETAELPMENFTLFLRPANTKAGNLDEMGFAEMRTLVSSLLVDPKFEKDINTFANLLSKNNWTTLGTMELRSFLKSRIAEFHEEVEQDFPEPSDPEEDEELFEDSYEDDEEDEYDHEQDEWVDPEIEGNIDLGEAWRMFREGLKNLIEGYAQEVLRGNKDISDDIRREFNLIFRE